MDDVESHDVLHPGCAAVTGAFSYTGRYVAQQLLQNGVSVKTLTGHPNRDDPFDGQVKPFSLNFSDPDALCRSLEGAEVLYNTYWVRFERGQTTFDRAVENSNLLFEAAKKAGVGKIVHFSVANATSESTLPYFQGKGRVEELLVESGLAYAIIRPTLVFGTGDLLLNNIAWALRRLPIFPVFGRGNYPVQPIYAVDLALQAVQAGSRAGNSIKDAAGPETFRFRDILGLLSAALNSRAILVDTPVPVGMALTQLAGLLIRDTVLTRDEVDGLSAGFLASDSKPTGTTRLRDWLKQNSHELGRQYVSEIRRNYRR